MIDKVLKTEKEIIMSKIMRDVNALPIEKVDVTGGFWYEKQKLVREVSMANVYKRFYETGRFDAFHFNWKEEDGEEKKPHIYWDSDVAKWIEAVGYICEKERDEKLEAIVDDVVDAIEKNRMPDGYFNSYFGHLEPQARFTRRNDHELYCLGHLIEGSIAYKRATGKDKLYKMMKEYADLVYDTFLVKDEAVFITPGHEEIELALVKLYRESGEKKYLDLAMHFVTKRGTDRERDNIPTAEPYIFQDFLPVRKQRDARGHAVRACYLYSAIADLVKDTGDEELFETAKSLFDNITRRRMYITGAIGQTPVGEAFLGDYDLPNQSAYAETCANLSLSLFARRMSLIDPDSKYADIAERVIYNSFISGMSLDGKSFFYSNMQENDSRVRTRPYNKRHTIFCPADTRVEVFKCSCCPPNVVRTISSIQDYQYSTSADTVYCHQFFGTRADVGFGTLEMKTDYPFDERVKIRYTGAPVRLALRIPGWCSEYEIKLCAKTISPEIIKGYAYIEIKGGDEISITFKMPTKFVEAHPMVWDDCGKVAITRGPIVYCLESVDNPYPLADVRISRDTPIRNEFDKELACHVLIGTGYIRDWKTDELYSEAASEKAVPVRLIPYFAFANRGATDLVIWTKK